MLSKRWSLLKSFAIPCNAATELEGHVTMASMERPGERVAAAAALLKQNGTKFFRRIPWNYIWNS
jgi:hypothetical protein